jgi:rSAM/selenodomain-associated transferase 2
MTISIIIPTYNEGSEIAELISHLRQHATAGTELIVVDGGSTDDTLQKANHAGACCLASPEKGRAAQMNLGVRHASGDLLYFVHADAQPPGSFREDIQQAVEEGYEAGCYRFKFDSDHPLLKINSYMTRFDRIMCRGGDQTLFVGRELFEKLGGYRDDYMIMEDYDLIERIQDAAPFKIIPKEVIVSARKYMQNNYLKVQLANFTVFMMYFGGCSQRTMVNTYSWMLDR